ncbi:MAG: LysR family transcriptional regulator [Sedimenticola sp.]
MNRLESIRTFIHVVERGSFSTAADHLNIAKSVVSKRIKELEAHLGAQLLHRTTRKLHLTQVGEVYYHRCLPILADLEEADHLVSEQQNELKGKIRIAAPLTFTLQHLMPVFNQFMEQYPDLELDLDLNDQEVDLVKEGFDLAVRIGELHDSTLIAKPLSEIRLITCASPDYLERHGEPKTVDELREHRILIYSNAPTSTLWPYGQSRFKIKARMSSNSGSALLQAAVAGIGIVITPTFLCYQELREGKLLPILVDRPIPSTKAYAVYPSRRYQPVRIRRLIETLQQCAAHKPYWDAF